MTANPLPSIEAALAWARAELDGGESPQIDAKVILQDSLDCNTAYLLTWPERQLSEAQWQAYQQLVAKRKAGEPVAYLLGYREFWSLKLAVSPATLIPRPDTEILVEEALKRIDPSADTSIVDLGTGTGAIALALASELPKASVQASDLQIAAVELARQNARSLGLERVSVKQGSWFEPFAGQRFTMVVSNPPYIDPDDPHLAQGDVRFEPDSALTAEQQGLADIASIVEQAPEYLELGGWLLFEHGYDQAEAVAQLLSQRGFVEVFNQKDYAGQARVSGGRWQEIR